MRIVAFGMLVWAASCAFVAGQGLARPTTDMQLEPSWGAFSTFGFSTSGATATTSDTSRAFAVLDVPAPTRAMVERMWGASPTFRRQCARLAEAGITVKIMLEQSWTAGRAHATSQIDIRNGLVRSVFARLRSVEPQYLAHEIEHVLEMIDRVDLRRAVASGVDGASESSPRAFETTRAVAVGRLVAEETGGIRR